MGAGANVAAALGPPRRHGRVPDLRIERLEYRPGGGGVVPAAGSAANGAPARLSDASSSYALYRGRCGFVAQFMRRVVDEAGREPGEETPT